MPKGPRIVFKDDRDSAIGRGCILHRGSLRPEVMAIVIAAARTAPPLEGNVLIVSEGWRNIREQRDLHEELRAFDISVHNIIILSEPRRAHAELWAERMSEDLGGEYDVVLHGEGSNLHIHGEFEP